VKTLQQFLTRIEVIPTTTTWYLADLGEARGKQELFTKQSPQTLKALREQALIESAVSSNPMLNDPSRYLDERQTGRQLHAMLYRRSEQATLTHLACS
jgi:hypothetical protein